MRKMIKPLTLQEVYERNAPVNQLTTIRFVTVAIMKYIFRIKIVNSAKSLDLHRTTLYHTRNSIRKKLYLTLTEMVVRLDKTYAFKANVGEFETIHELAVKLCQLMGLNDDVIAKAFPVKELVVDES